MQIVLPDIVHSNYCYYDIHSGCVKGLEKPETTVCSRCLADAHADISRTGGL
ncbi:MAG: hypothetical protein ACXWET_05020 [Halobacteriota archaeon]